MVREIRFRGLRITGSGFIYGSLIIDKISGKYYINENHVYSNKIGVMYCNCYEVYPKTVGEFTGKTLKDGTDLYVGDIVLVQGRKRIGLYETVVIEVDQGFSLERNDTYINDDKCFAAIKEVIGTTYEHLQNT